MASFDETIIREYFELNGFFVRQLRKHVVQSRKKTVDTMDDLVIYKPDAPEAPEAPEAAPLSGFQLFSSDVANLRRAVVGIHSWHASTFSPAILKSSPKSSDFLKKEVVARMDTYFNAAPSSADESTENPYVDYAKILVVPAFPTSDAHRIECTELLKAKGVDGVIVFSTILENLLRSVAVNHSYSKSDLLQLLRVLKIYDMIREPQMTLFF